MIDPIEYFCRQASKWRGFQGNHFDCEDKNLRAFESLASFIAWYGQPPGQEPYRDDGFYTRELAYLSMSEPRTIVEIGTALGIGTLLLAMLNPKAEIITVDNRNLIPAADGWEYVAGSLAKHNGAAFTGIIADTTDWPFRGADLYFIDGDHSYEGVRRDSAKAFDAAHMGARIMWHDYNERHPGNVQAVNEFCRCHELALRTLPDSCTVWTAL